jgi:uncharacterized cupin superfamily protein
LESHPGVFVAKSSTADFHPDPDIPGTEMHELVHADGVWAGFTRIAQVDGPMTWTPDRREIAMILEGTVRIEIAGADPLDLEVGDLFSIPPGVETTWHVTTPFKEMWVLASPEQDAP